MTNINNTKWTTESDALASQQGWGLFEVDRVLQIQRDDGAEIFESDEAALEHVIARAASGDKVAQAALQLNNTQERWKAI